MSNRGVPSNGFRMTNKRKDAIEKASKMGIHIDPSIFANPITRQMGVDEIISYAQGINPANNNPQFVGYVNPIEEEYSDVEIDVDVIKSQIKERFSALKDVTIATALGLNRSLIVSGSAGVGKSHDVDQYVQECTARYVFVKGYTTPSALYKVLYDNRFSDNVIVFDDCDSVFDNETSLNILKAACDTSDVRTISWYTSGAIIGFEGDEIPNSYEFGGNVIFITNKDFYSMIAKDNKMSPHYEALVSRSMYLDLGLRTHQERLIRIRQVISESDMLDGIISQNDIDMLMDWLDNNRAKIREGISLRTARKIATLMAANPNNWESLANMVLCKK